MPRGVMTKQRSGLLLLSLLLVMAMLFSATHVSVLSYDCTTVARYIQTHLPNDWIADAGSAETDWLLQCEHASKRLATPSISSTASTFEQSQEQCPEAVLSFLFLCLFLFVPRKILPSVTKDADPFLI